MYIGNLKMRSMAVPAHIYKIMFCPAQDYYRCIAKRWITFLVLFAVSAKTWIWFVHCFKVLLPAGGEGALHVYMDSLLTSPRV